MSKGNLDTDRVGELIKVYDALDQSGAPLSVQDKVHKILRQWDEYHAEIAKRAWENGDV